MTEHEFSQVMHILTLAHPEKTLTADGIKAYYAVLNDIEADALRAAALHLLATSKWFPKPSELRETVFDLAELTSEVPDAYTAWEDVLRETRRIGHSQLPRFAHELTAITVNRIGGWRNLCMSTNQVADRSRFVKAYAILMKRERMTTRMLPEVRELALKLSAGEHTLLGQ